MSVQQASLLEVRNNIGKYLDNLGDDSLTITKRGKPIAVVLNSDAAKDFFEWKKKQELKEFYYKNKPKFEKLGEKFLQKLGKDEVDLTIDELVELVGK